MSVAPPFEADGPLPAARLAVEASAGTGKTYTLTALAVRFLAEQDVAISQLLVVTFTRAATHELRARVRSRLVQAHAHLAAGCPETDDDVLTAIADADEAERTRRLRRLETAVTDFDAATITPSTGSPRRCSPRLACSSGPISTPPSSTMPATSPRSSAPTCWPRPPSTPASSPRCPR